MFALLLLLLLLLLLMMMMMIMMIFQAKHERQHWVNPVLEARNVRR